MKKWLIIAAKVLVWLVLMGTYFNVFVMNGKAPFYLTTDWFSSSSSCPYPIKDGPYWDENWDPCAIGGTANTSGFPVHVFNDYNDGPYALVWAINIGYAILVGISLALLLMGKFKKAAIAGGILVLTYGLLAIIVSLF